MRRNIANNHKSAVIAKIEEYTQSAPDRYGKDGWEIFIHRPCGNIVINDHYEVYRQSDGKRGFFYLRRWYTGGADIAQGLTNNLVKLFTSIDEAHWRHICGEYTAKESYEYFIAHGQFFPTINLHHLERRIDEYKTYIKDLYILVKVYFPRINYERLYKAAADAAWDIINAKFPTVTSH